MFSSYLTPAANGYLSQPILARREALAPFDYRPIARIDDYGRCF